MEPSECEIHGPNPSYKVDDAQTIRTAAESKVLLLHIQQSWCSACKALIGVHASRHASCQVLPYVRKVLGRVQKDEHSSCPMPQALNASAACYISQAVGD